MLHHGVLRRYRIGRDMSARLLAGIVLAAGKGTRMVSDLPKCLHEVCGEPMILHVLRALKGAGSTKQIVVVGHGAEAVIDVVGEQATFAKQEVLDGTGGAVKVALKQLSGFEGDVVVLAGDAPLLTSEMLSEVWEEHTQSGADLTMATFRIDDPTGYGRIVRENGEVVAIVEHAQASEEQLKIDEVNPSVYFFTYSALEKLVPMLSAPQGRSEIYITDAVSIALDNGMRVKAKCYEDGSNFLGVNSQWDLAKAGEVMRKRILKRLAEAGVVIIDPSSTHIGSEVRIAPGAVIQPMTVIEGWTEIGSESTIGPHTWIKDSKIGKGCKVFMSHVDTAVMDDRSRCGPFANLRPDTKLSEDVKIGNFVEIKNSSIGPKTAVSHLAYVGDAEVGYGTNIGAGTITCNYDGFNKSRTIIGNNVFVGSNSTLIAPIEIGDGSLVAAGSVITVSVGENDMAIGRAKQENRVGWATSWRKRKQTKT